MYSIPSNHDEIELTDGKIRPARVRNTKCDRILFLADSRQRTAGSAFKFQITGYRPIYGQSCYISRVMLPKLPNINPNDNTLQITNANGTFTILLPTGYYNQISLVNILDAGLNAAGTGDVFTVTYNNTNKTINVTAAALPFYFVAGTSFDLYGINVAHWDSFPAGSDPALVGSLSQNSSILGLVYTRYVTITSDRLCANPMDIPRLSNGKTNVVAVISVAEHFQSSDYDATGTFNGVILVDQSFNDSAVLRIAAQKKDLTLIDYMVQDEFGYTLDLALNLGAGYSTNSLGCLIWLTITL